jgi:hypothetical protein
VGIVEVSRRTPYKIVTWVLLGLGGLFLLIGLLFMVSSMASSPTMPSSINVTATGITQSAAPNEFSLNVTQRETSVMINTAPLGSGSRVTFDILNITDALRITDSNERDLVAKNRNGRHINAIWPGESATLTLIGGAETSFQFGETVRIQIRSEGVSAFLNVHISLPVGQEAGFDFHIRDEAFWFQYEVISAQQYYNEVYRHFVEGREPHPRTRSSFEFISRFMVWGSEVRNIDTTITPVDLDSGIRLRGASPGTEGFGASGFANVFIPQEIVVAVMSSKIPMEFTFMISTDHFGKHIDFFTLRIV